MDELKPGYKFKNFPCKIMNKIGRGGQCIVYRVKRGKEEYAVKQLILTPEYIPFQEQYINMFKREYELLSVLAHPLLPKAYNFFQEKGEYFIVVEFISGKNLSEIMEIRKKSLTEGAALELACRIGELLVYLTSRQSPIILRDIKPANIILTEEGQVKFIDLTIARHYSPQKKDTMKLGSPGYAPPEQYRGESSVKSDVYSLGVTLHELLTLQDPSLNLHNLPPVKSLNNSVSDKLCNIIKMSTELKPENRLAPEELNEILKNIYNSDIFLKSMSPLRILSNEIYGPEEKKVSLLKNYIEKFNVNRIVNEGKVEKSSKTPEKSVEKTERKKPSLMSKKAWKKRKKHIDIKEEPLLFHLKDYTDHYAIIIVISLSLMFLVYFFLAVLGVTGNLVCIPPFLFVSSFLLCKFISDSNQARKYIIGDSSFISMDGFSRKTEIQWDKITSFGFRLSDNKYIVEGDGKNIIFGKDVLKWEDLKNIIEKRSSLPCMSIEGEG